MITMEGKVVKDSALVRSDYDFTVKSGQEVWFDVRENLLGKFGKPHLHGNLLNEECILFKDPPLDCMIDSDMKKQGRGKPCC